MIQGFENLDEGYLRKLLEDDEPKPSVTHGRERDPKSISRSWLSWLADQLNLATKDEVKAVTSEVKNIGDLNAVIDVLSTEVPALIAKLDEVLLKLSDNPDVSDQIAAAKDRLAEMAATIQTKLNPPTIPADDSGSND